MHQKNVLRPNVHHLLHLFKIKAPFFFLSAVPAQHGSPDFQEENWVRLFSEGTEVDIQEEARAVFTFSISNLSTASGGGLKQSRITFANL